MFYMVVMVPSITLWEAGVLTEQLLVELLPEDDDARPIVPPSDTERRSSRERLRGQAAGRRGHLRLPRRAGACAAARRRDRADASRQVEDWRGTGRAPGGPAPYGCTARGQSMNRAPWRL